MIDQTPEVPQRVWCGVCAFVTTWGPRHVVDAQMESHYVDAHGIELAHSEIP